MIRKHIVIALFALVATVPCTLPAIGGEATDVIVAQQVTLHSTVLDEDRQLIISTPPGYDNSDVRYPVLYITDGGGDFYHAYGIARNYANYQILPPMIIVAITNTDRTRDLTPTHTTNGFHGNQADFLKTSGGADNFLKFIEQDVLPYVEQHYRVMPFRVLSGHSFGGLFVFHTFLTRTNLFNGYIAISPSLWWDNQVLPGKAEDKLGEMSCPRQFLYFTVGGLEDENQVGPNQRMARLLRKDTPEGLTWSYKIMMDETHGSQGLPALDAGLRFIYSEWEPSREIYDKGLAAVKQHYANLKQVYGVEVPIPEIGLNIMGYGLLNSGELDKALEVMALNVELYPGSPNVYDSIGDVYAAREEWDKAESSYRKAVELGTAVNDTNLPIFKRHLEDVIKRKTP